MIAKLKQINWKDKRYLLLFSAIIVGMALLCGSFFETFSSADFQTFLELPITEMKIYQLALIIYIVRVLS